MRQTPVVIETCPYLQPRTDAGANPVSYAVYCSRRDRHVRIPSRDELTRFCVSGHHLDCPGYRGPDFSEMFLSGVPSHRSIYGDCS